MAHIAAASGDVKFFERLEDNDKERKHVPAAITSLLSLFHKPVTRAAEASDVSVHTFNKYGFAPIHAAAFHGHPDVILLLTSQFGASPNQPTRSEDDRWTLPLHLAVVRNNVQCARTLLKQGADPWLRDGEGWDAWEVARRCGRRRCHALLRTHYRKEKEEFMGIIEAGVCTVVHQPIFAASNAALPLPDCHNCDIYVHTSSDLHRIPRTHSDNQLSTRHREIGIRHARLKIPHGPWDVEVGIDYIDHDLPSDMDVVECKSNDASGQVKLTIF